MLREHHCHRALTATHTLVLLLCLLAVPEAIGSSIDCQRRTETDCDQACSLPGEHSISSTRLQNGPWINPNGLRNGPWINPNGLKNGPWINPNG